MISTLSKIFKQLTEGSDLNSGESTHPNLVIASLFLKCLELITTLMNRKKKPLCPC